MEKILWIFAIWCILSLPASLFIAKMIGSNGEDK